MPNMELSKLTLRPNKCLMWDSTTHTYQNSGHHTPKTKTHTKKWLQTTCLTIIYLLVGTSGCYQYLKTEKVLFL